MVTASEITRFYEYVAGLGLKFPVAAISKATGFSKGNVSQYLSKTLEPSENFMNAVYEKFPIDFKKVPRATSGEKGKGKGDPDLSLQGLIASNDKLAQANLTLADAHKIIARNNEELIGRLRTIEHVPEYNPLADPSIQSKLLEVLAELGVGKLWKTKTAGLIELGNALSLPDPEEGKVGNTRTGAGRKSTAERPA